MTRLERYREKLRKLENKRNELIRSGRYVQSVALNDEIKNVERLIKEAEEYEESCKPKPIGELLTKEEIDDMGIIPLMIECHLAADFLTEVAYMVLDTCKEHGLENVSFMSDLRELIKKSDMFASFLTKVSPDLCDMLVRNETFNVGLHKRYLKYIERRLK